MLAVISPPHQLGLPRATFYRWQERAEAATLADRVVVPRRQAPQRTPHEIQAVRNFALEHPAMGYKRLSWSMVYRHVILLRPYQVYRILKTHDLLCRQPRPEPETLKRPPAASRPDQVWHIDLMYLYIRPRWYYLVDILDAYSRYLVHWTLNTTMVADTVTLTAQEALEGLSDRSPGEPRIVAKHGLATMGASS